LLLAADADSDGLLSKREFFSVAVPYAQGKGIDEAKAAWAILDGNCDGAVSEDRVRSSAEWAHLSPEMLSQLLPAGQSSLSRNDFLSTMVSRATQAWTRLQQEWCCQHKGICSEVATSTSMATQSIRPLHDCHDGYDDWWHKWGYDKRVWCCSNYARGCPDVTLPPESMQLNDFDCAAGFSNWQTGWSSKKKQWCCRHEQRGCFMYNCSHGRGNWLFDWTLQKKEWCCTHGGAGCMTATTSLPFDCHAGFSNWKAGWSVSKKAWCCQEYRMACEEDAFDCSAGVRTWEKGWSGSKKAWCCAQRGIACMDTAPSQPASTSASSLSHVPSTTITSTSPFDCGATDVSWSPRQKAWCCLHENICPHDGDDDDYDCGVGLAHWRSLWSDSKKEWCCKHYHRGCDFDCRAGLLTWKTGWSTKKKAWCCQHKGFGCLGAASPSYDCSAGSSSSWPAAKRDWCCKFEHEGCVTNDIYNCSVPTHGWSDQQSDWCCRHKNSGCAYDCRSHMSDWQDQWSTSQKKWCCDHTGLGCDR